MDSLRISLTPAPGYCFKTTALSDVETRLTTAGTLRIQNATKVFVNIAWDQNVPPPPPASEEAIQRAIRLEEDTRDLSFKDVLKQEEEDWSVPVVVSEPRQDIDKAGNPSVVFDCVYNSSLKSRALRDAEFRAYLNELSLQRIELQTTASSVPSPASPNGLILSREIKTPNIASKGKLAKRSVLVPRKLYAAASVPIPGEAAKSLVEEVRTPESSTAGLEVKPAAAPKKGILKTPPKIEEVKALTPKKPTHKWTEESNKRCLILDVPNLTRAIHASSVLDVEPRRIIFSAPPLYSLDLDDVTGDELDVDGAKAEWRVKEGRLLVYV
ncbi:hypothetical protein BXZ70DRAFT_957492 [Cristinia sonorae]|uniref:PIH1 N-terminal domain-containing protein n=1 Tax=Cristinia sonorae TaxID=1940300 RepID=A0A8K0XL12_9AGAR|nr:hypothetical protein BXZ70DRAFT_957492 [Cristinia sonorae]